VVALFVTHVLRRTKNEHITLGAYTAQSSSVIYTDVTHDIAASRQWPMQSIRSAVMANGPDFDFEFPRGCRFRGWGVKGLAALFSILLTAIVITGTAGAWGKGLWDYSRSPSVAQKP
jgi:hypothetical protein